MTLRQPKSTISLRDRIPFDLAAAERMPGWRDGFAWPLPHPEIYKPVMGFMRRVIAAANACTDEGLRDVLLICLPRMAASAATLMESALWVQAAERTGLEIEGGPEAIYRLKGDKAPDTVEFTRPSEAHRTPLRWPLLRRLARIKSWTPLPRLPLTLLNPHAEAISHNSLLRVCARSQRIGYRHADLMLPRQSAGPQPMQTRAMQALNELLAGAMEGTEELAPNRRELAISLVRDEVTAHIEEGVRLVTAARQIRTLPRAIWAGTGGYRPARAIRLEARRRGIPVTGFDHSATAGLIAEREAFTVGELSVCDRFVATTQGTAELLLEDDQPSLLPNISKPEIVGGPGDPIFAWRLPSYTGNGRTRPRVLYVSGAFIGFRQRTPPRIPDIVKLDWQLRLVEALNEMPVDLMTQMHPGGLLRGQPHPVHLISKASGTTFEKAAAWSDILLFDVVQSTTFTLALCTDRPIVLIDHGMNKFSRPMLAMLQRRCAILKVSHDDRNRPVIDRDALEAALLQSRGPADPTEFRALYAGSFA